MESLFRVANELQIKIIYIPLGHINNGLFGLSLPESRTIILDVKLLQPEYDKLHRCIMAEEIGHMVAGATVNALGIHTNYSLNRKITEEEEKALLWATEKLIPTNEITLLLQEGFFNCEDLADYFGVTVWFMFRKLEFMQVYCEDKKDIIRPVIKKAKISCF
ncbi:ImmA/IrrE family metallo-endopeptidase [Desulfoscipio geothermicus]|uniref:IrrE N-terminal-like domain-containing protein n=1 Tax=Desulfoscipio geothermicus DSM 3669 TaxID=1121426 RepID=A0A1I6E3W2_9FIRM|nr:ImmA/IrrE family metallo-endopeptidase [Desulfoscipio geothermicus]SFR12413.1 protein of unknown function [Desulfoscipio geothermicus DSM 3669]